MNEAEYIPIDYKSFVAHIRESGTHVPQADHRDNHLGSPVTAKFYRMPDGTVYGIKEWHGEEVIVPVQDVGTFDEFFPPQGTTRRP